MSLKKIKAPWAMLSATDSSTSIDVTFVLFSTMIQKDSRKKYLPYEKYSLL